MILLIKQLRVDVDYQGVPSWLQRGVSVCSGRKMSMRWSGTLYKWC